MKQIKVLSLFNYCPWVSIPKKLKRLHDTALPFIDYQFEARATTFDIVPFEKIAENQFRPSQDWIKKNIQPLGVGYDMVHLTIPNSQWRGETVNGYTYVELGVPMVCVVHADEDEILYNNPDYPAWYERMQHESDGHGLRGLTGQERVETVVINGQTITDSITHIIERDHRLDSPEALSQIDFSKYVSVSEQGTKEEKISSLKIALASALEQLTSLLLKQKMLNRLKLYSTAFSYLGTDASPNDVAPDEFGCAETVCDILIKAFGPSVGIKFTVSTNLLYNELEKSSAYTRVDQPLQGDIVISPTGYGNGTLPNGHVGIVGESGMIMSNDSATGKFLQNYTIDTWKGRYVTVGGYPMVFYRKV